MSIRSRQSRVAQPIYDVPTMPPWPPSYDSIYSSSEPYIPMRLVDVKRPLSEVVSSPGRHDRVTRPLSDVVSLSSAGSRRSYASSSPRLAETSFMQYSNRSSVHSIDPSRMNNEPNTQQALAPLLKPSGLLCIRIAPGDGGRYGFRVRGGADLNRPITVGRVYPQGPADVCDPKPQLGDQILFINGVEVSNSTHEEVVKLIRSSHETVGELFLVVKRRDPHGESSTSPVHTDFTDKQRRPTSELIRDQKDVQYHFLGDY